MCKSEIFAEIISLVEEETEVTSERILSMDKDMEVVDARSMLVVLLFENGFYPSNIAKLINKTHRCVNYLIAEFKEREKGSRIIRIQMERLRNRLGQYGLSKK